MLNQVFSALLLRHGAGEAQAAAAWDVITRQYGHRKRYYHNLQHLEAMYHQLQPLQPHIQDWDTLLFSLFYHDAVYNVLKKDNEERSAEMATTFLKEINYPVGKVELCGQQIMATKSHVVHVNPDVNFFTDADLSILGQEREVYRNYTLQIRKEYGIYPAFVYKPARKNVVAHFLGMERIYKTQPFFDGLEKQARKNLQWELDGFIA
ncbi:MAG: hypothetical protein NTW29_06905 [Bacteroidetes bacterium]|nr:hypothetical protein [Bacteroidota bacterium]